VDWSPTPTRDSFKGQAKGLTLLRMSIKGSGLRPDPVADGARGQPSGWPRSGWPVCRIGARL